MPDISHVNLPDGVTYNITDLNALHHITAPEYDATSTYNRGDFVTYQGDVYICDRTITTPEPWNQYDWELAHAHDDSYLHSLNPNGAGSFGMNRKPSTTVGYCSFAEGLDNEASGSISHAEGSNTVASGSPSHAEGGYTEASGDYSHAEGYDTVASGAYSHAEGRSTISNHQSQHVFGAWNIADPSAEGPNYQGNYVEIVGNGTKGARSNARTLDWNGNEVLAGDLTINGSTSVTTSLNNKADKVAPPDYDPTSTYNLGDFVTYNGNIYICKTAIATPEAWNSNHWKLVDADQSYLHSLDPKGAGSFSINRKASTTIGMCSFAEGYDTTASGVSSHAEGNSTTASGVSSHAEGYNTTASTYSHAEGYYTTASGVDSHAEGNATTASGYSSHSEGYNTTASGNHGPHSEGYNTSASGDFGAHAEGISTIASGDYGAHAEGVGTTANHRAQHTFGEYNVVDPSTAASYDRGNYVEIVGNGTADITRSNARTLDWSGNEVLSGGLKINSTQDVATQVSLTQAEYDALVSAGTVDLVNTIYFITDANAVAGSAAEITYSNTTSGLSANTVQSAIDEIASEKADLSLIPSWIIQTPGTTFGAILPCAFFYYYADQWTAYVQLPFVMKNVNYSVSLDDVIAENIGSIVSKCSVVTKQYCYFEVRTTKTMPSFPNLYSTNAGRCRFTITFA